MGLEGGGPLGGCTAGVALGRRVIVMKKARFAAGVLTQPLSSNRSWIDMNEGLLIELEARNASWADVDLSESEVEDDGRLSDGVQTQFVGE